PCGLPWRCEPIDWLAVKKRLRRVHMPRTFLQLMSSLTLLSMFTESAAALMSASTEAVIVLFFNSSL
ncbi:MAG TPA: hypothetical protein VKB96_04140, partial [Gammaproteobacteria bacterium]|nr:hypothetical protein [Gammaproteobacteria bacterium]